MFRFLKLKSLFFGLLVASPAFAAWAYRQPEKTVTTSQVQAVSFPPVNPGQAVQIPIEVIEKGSPPKMIYVEHEVQAVPEPGFISLFTLTSLFLAFRRQR